MDDTGIRALPRACFTQPDMMMYEDRLQSFKQWPNQIVPDKYSLAKAGFIYRGEGDVVQCFGCNIRVSQWNRTDLPLAEHLKWSPDCIFLKMIGYGAPQDGVQTVDRTKEPRGFTGFTGFNFRRAPDNAVQSNPQPGGAHPFGTGCECTPQREPLLHENAKNVGVTLGGGVYVPSGRNLFAGPGTGQ